MKNFLAIDTSCNYLTVLAVKDGQTFSKFLPDCSMRHSVKLMETVDAVLKEAEMRLQDFDFFAAVVGAGSFTGIRIAISAVKGFCLATGKPSLSVTSFDVAAYNAVDEGKILCLVDALHDCYYACGYEKGKISLQPAFLEEAEVLRLAQEGYALTACSPMPIQDKAKLTLADPVLGLKNAACALTEQGKFGELTALYVRKSSAELNQR